MSRARGATAIILAAGAGRRLGAAEPKAFLTVGGRPLLLIAASAASASPAIAALVVTVPAGMEDRAKEALEGVQAPWSVITGGDSRQASVAAALAVVPSDVEVVVCHDAARPFAPPDLFTSVVGALSDGADGATPVLPVADTVKRIADGVVVGTEPREGVGLAQTPQAFRAAALREAHERAAQAGVSVTDDSELLEWAGYHVVVVAGEPRNFKITTLFDHARAEARMQGANG